MTPVRAGIGARSPNAHHFTPPLPTLQHQDAMFAPPLKLAAMPVLSRAGLRIDFTDEGAGPPVVLVHSSVSGNRQWRALGEDLADRHRVLAVNLYGYGETTPWPALEPQSLAAQAELDPGRLRRGSRCGAASSATPSAARSRSWPHCCSASRVDRPRAARAQSLPPPAAGRARPGLARDRRRCATT